jgi:hypothetical protein
MMPLLYTERHCKRLASRDTIQQDVRHHNSTLGPAIDNVRYWHLKYFYAALTVAGGRPYLKRNGRWIATMR